MTIEKQAKSIKTIALNAALSFSPNLSAAASTNSLSEPSMKKSKEGSFKYLLMLKNPIDIDPKSNLSQNRALLPLNVSFLIVCGF